MGNTFPKLHQVIGIVYNNGPNTTHGRTITSSDAYHKATNWVLHHMNDLVLFRRYTWSLHTLELKRTYSLLAFHYHWKGMYAQVRNVITRCEQCDRVRTSFSSQQLTLSPPPIQGMFYHWSCDLGGKLPLTSRGNVYIMIMIEHFSKWVELVGLSNKSSHNTNQAFLQQVLSRFGVCAKCLTNQGSKFRGEFQDLFDHVFIDHHQTSKDHPQVDGLEERMVYTCKKGLCKICLTKNKKDWDLALPYITMGYMMSKQAM